MSMNNFVAPYAIGPFPPRHFKFDTTGAENLIARMIANSASTPFNGVYSGQGRTDPFNALIRLTAYMQTVVQHFGESMLLGDQFAKPAALYVSAQLESAIMKYINKKFK